jgi:hypothetical protein
VAEILAQVEAANKKVTIEQLRKLEVLRDFLSIPDVPGWPHLLSLRLAMDQYAGFSVKYEERRGRKKKWEPSEYLELVAAIETIKREKGCGDRQAVRLYLKRGRKAAPTHTEVRSLEARLTEARDPRKNPFAKMFSTGDPEHDAHMLGVILKHFKK